MIQVREIKKMRAISNDRYKGLKGKGQGMNFVDCCGWLEYFANGSNAGFTEVPVESRKKAIEKNTFNNFIFPGCYGLI
jgi:hypothetical protein